MTTPATFDPAALCEAFDHDFETIRQLLALVIRDLPRYEQTLVAAAESGDLAIVGRMAHTIRSTVSNVRATHLCEVAEALEQAGRTRDPARVAALRPGFHDAVAALVDELSAWTRTVSLAGPANASGQDAATGSPSGD